MAGPFPFLGQGSCAGEFQESDSPNVPTAWYFLMWGPPGPYSPIRHPLACGENTRCGALRHVWELLVLASRDGERQRNPAFHLMTCRRRCGFIYFFFFKKRAQGTLWYLQGTESGAAVTASVLNPRPTAVSAHVALDLRGTPGRPLPLGRPGGPQGLA